MNNKLLITFFTAFLSIADSFAQNQESTDSLKRTLNEIIVEAKQPATKLEGTMLVTAIAGSNLANLGTALDVLTQLPLIKVTDETVSITGKNNVEIYIDGRPMHDSFELQQILSSNLQKVELDMAPGAEYDSTTGAVLRIITQRNFFQGLSLSEQFQLQRRRKWSALDNLNISFRRGSFEFFINGMVNRNNSVIKGSTTNTLLFQNKETVIGCSQNNSYPTTTGIVKAGFNRSKNAQSFGAYYRFNPERGDFVNSGSEWLDNNPAITREINKRTRAHSHLMSVYYENTFANKYQLHFDGDYRQSAARNYVLTYYSEGSNADVNSTDNRQSTLCAGKLYLKFPLLTGDFTVGAQDSYTHTSLDFRMLNPLVGKYIPSTLTDATQISAALFATWSRAFGKFMLSAGLRYDYTDYIFKINGERDKDMSNRRHLLTPDLSFSYTINDETQLSLSYKYASVKPPYSQLTGSLNYVGLHEIEGGNPALRDEKSHNIQLFGMWKNFMLQADMTRSIDSYAFVKQLYPARNLQLIMHPQNINVSSLSAYIIWSQPVGCWTPSITAGAYRQWLEIANTSYDKPIFSFYFDNAFSFTHNWSITANISGNSGGDMHTNRFGKSWFTMDASVSKTFFDKSLTVKLTATDIFNSANNDWTMNTFGVCVSKRQRYDRRGITLSVIYNLRPRKSSYKGAAAADSEMDRL